MKFSNKSFYNRHKNEMSKYIFNKNTLHIVGKYSANKINLKGCETIVLDLTKHQPYPNSDINKKFENKYKN